MPLHHPWLTILNSSRTLSRWSQILCKSFFNRLKNHIRSCLTFFIQLDLLTLPFLLAFSGPHYLAHLASILPMFERTDKKNTMSHLRTQNFYFLIPILRPWWSKWLTNMEGSTTLMLFPMVKIINTLTYWVQNHICQQLYNLESPTTRH